MVTEKMIEALKPCPFCGGSDVHLRHHQANQMSWVSCVGCGLEAPSETGVTDDEAVAYWNRRAEADLSTDAEPDGWICENDFTLDPYLAWKWEDIGLSPKPFYFSPQQHNAEPVEAAPSVAVKALEWAALSPESPTSHHRAETPIGPYEIDCGPAVSGGRWTGNWTTGRFHTLEKAKAAAQADYEARIRTALSAQVQDVAKTETYYTTENNWENMFFGPGASKTEMDLIWDFGKQNWANADFRIIMTAAPAAKLEGKP